MEQTRGKACTSHQDFQRNCFPSEVLNRLDKTLCSTLGLDEEYQHRLSKSNQNPLVGSLELAKTPGYFSQYGKEPIESAVRKFYNEEGFKVKNDGFIYAIRGDEHYRILVVEHATSWMVNVDNL